MAKIKLNPIIEEVRGQLGELVFRKSNGKITLSRKPAASSIGPSEAQVAQRDRLRLAVAYGKFVIADTTTRAIYENAAEQKGTSAFALTVADFLNLPSVDQVDVSGYHGQIGNNIAIITSDDIGVV